MSTTYTPPALTQPLPVPTPLTQPFWDALAEHKVRIQYSPSLGEYIFYPRPLAPRTLTQVRKVLDGRISVLIGVVVLLAVIHVSYQYLVAPTYAYMLLTYTSPNLAVYTVMLALLVLIAAILPVRLVKPSDFLLWIVYLLVVITRWIVRPARHSAIDP